MTPPKFEIHASDCCCGNGGYKENCECSGASYVAVRREELEELVEAAESVVLESTPASPPSMGTVYRLEKSLTPFGR